MHTPYFSFTASARLLFLTASMSVFAAIGLAQTVPASAIATVNGVPVPQALLEQSVKANLAQGQKDSPELRQIIRDELINREILAQEAARLGLDKTPESQTQWAQLRQNFMVEILLNDQMKRNPLSEAALKAEYDRQVLLWKDQQQYRLSLIVTATEDEAKAILARLRKGEAFSKVATEKSIDPSKKDGGNVGWVLAAQILPAISNVMVNLTKGALAAAPIQTQSGWNVIKLEETRPFKTPTFEEAQNDVRQMMLQKQRSDYVKTLRDSAKVAQ